MSVRTLLVNADGMLQNRVFLDDPRVLKLLAMLDGDGEAARVVGGAVRNAAIGLAPGDVDIATTATPETVMQRARTARLRFVPTGLAHGTVTVVLDGLPLEVTTLREDIETDGRHATVRFGRDFAADAQRRDFTINALSVDRQGKVHDYAGGLEDLAAGAVRFIGDPAVRIREDFLRILRFFRFSAAYAVGDLDPTGVAACMREAAGLRLLSRERIRAELMKLLVAPRAPDIVAGMDKAGLLGFVVGTACRPPRLARCRAIEAARDGAPDPILELAALVLSVETDVGTLRDALRLSNEERDRLARLAACLFGPDLTDHPPDARAVSRLLFAYGRQTTIDAVTLWHADSDAPAADPVWQAAARFASIAVLPTLPVSGADIMARGVSRGPLVGHALKEFQALWIRAGFPQQPTLLHDLLDRAIAAAREIPNRPA